MPKWVRTVFGVAAIVLGLTSSARAASCGQERSAADVKIMIDRCVQVSPATHPPCNAQNACAMIEDEISRGCGLLPEKDRPGFCADYLDD